MSAADPSAHCDCRQVSVRRANYVGIGVVALGSLAWLILLLAGRLPASYVAQMFANLGVITLGIAPMFLPQSREYRRWSIMAIAFGALLLAADLSLLLR